jgi:CHAT domain-containing protein
VRILAIVSRPDGFGPVVSGPIIERMQALGSGYEIRHLENGPRTLLRSTIETWQPHIVHYIGHGRFNRDKNDSELALVKMDEVTVAWVDGGTFSELFDQWQPRLVILQACEGGVGADAATNFATMVPRLIIRTIPAVVAMQYQISNPVATQFGTTFYSALAERKPVDTAIQRSRSEIAFHMESTYSQRDFGTPVLYMRGRSGYILPKPTE